MRDLTSVAFRGRTPSSAASRWLRTLASGVRSSWATSLTSALRCRLLCSMDSAIELKAPANWATSSLPEAATREVVSPVAMRWAAVVSARIGRTSRRPASTVIVAAARRTAPAVAAVRRHPAGEKASNVSLVPR